MTYDTQVPENLKKMQQWFGRVIERPIDENCRINPVAPSGRAMEDEAGEWIIPSPTLNPLQRIEIYNQQFWWRLMGILHDQFPLVVRLFGYHEFNELIAKPYIDKYLPNNWSLNYLGNRIVQWADEEYHEADRSLIRDAIRIDWEYNASFFAAHSPSISTEVMSDEEKVLSLYHTKLVHQPHLKLFQLDHDLFRFRDELMEEDPDYWLDNDFPEMKKERIYHFVLFRNLDNQVVYEEISPGEFHLLKQFQKSMSFDQAIQWLEKQNEEWYHEAEQELPLWIQKWVQMQWLTFNKETIPYEQS